MSYCYGKIKMNGLKLKHGNSTVTEIIGDRGRETNKSSQRDYD